jgi:hypothetical protein
MWSSWIKTKGTTQVMYIAKLKDDPKRAKKTLNDFGKGFWNGMMKGEKITSKKIFEVEVFFSSQNIDFPFIWGDSWSFSFSSSFSFSFFLSFSILFLSFFYAPSLEDLVVLWYLRRKFTSSKTFFSNGLTWNGIVMTVDILTVYAYSGIELCTPI